MKWVLIGGCLFFIALIAARAITRAGNDRRDEPDEHDIHRGI